MAVRVALTLAFLLVCTAWPSAATGWTTPRAVEIMAPVAPAEVGRVQTLWSSRDGVPASPDFLMPDSDGILLLASQRRLYRFDGARFSAVEDADGSPVVVDGIVNTFAGENGDVWIGTRMGEILRVGRRSVERFGLAQGLPDNAEVRAVAAQDGKVLAGTARGLYRLQRGRWRKVELPGLAESTVWAVRFDGTQWWGIGGSQLVRIARDLRSMESVSRTADDVNSQLFGDARVGVWYWQPSGDRNLCRLGDAIACYTVRVVGYPQIDRDGVIWWPDRGKLFALDAGAPRGAASATERGLVRVLDIGGEFDEVVPAPDGTLWGVVGGRLMRLARTPVERVPIVPGAVIPAAGGKAWVAAFSSGLHLVGRPEPGAWLFRNDEGDIRAGARTAAAPGSLRKLTPAEAGLESRPVMLAEVDGIPDSIVRLDRGKDGSAFAATLTPPTLWMYDGRQWRQHSALPVDKGAVVRGIAQDSRGNVYVGATRDRDGLHVFDGTRWSAVPWRADGETAEIAAVHVDVRDRIWLGHRTSVTVLAQGKARTYRQADGVPGGPIRAIQEVDGDLWVIGMFGVSRFHDGAFQPLRLDSRQTISGITGFAIDDAGAMWLGAAQGIVRISRDQWSAAISRPGMQARVTLLGELQGVAHPAVDTAPLPTVTRLEDDSLWFNTLGAVYRIDPRRAGAPQPAPPLAITAVVADGVRLTDGRIVEVPAGTHRLAFPFRALAPVVPERTALRYRVSGLDEGWTPATGGEVVLDRLPPGDFALELQASAEDGAWSGTPSRLAFSMPPTFWQSIWSRLLLAALLCVATALAILWRARLVDARRRAIAEAEHREREKIARDIHDTLLQGVNGLLMTMQATVGRLDCGTPVRERLEGSMDMAERILVEGRDRVSALRSFDCGTLDLARELQIHARDLAQERRIMCEVRLQGEPRPLLAAAQDEMIQIGREALTNAFHHSFAGEIVLAVDYSADGVRIEVVDNGVGLQPVDEARSGHWGIQGMRERAAAIGGTLDVCVRTEGGTRVSLAVPAAAAYPRATDGRAAFAWKKIASVFGLSLRARSMG
ncbi:MAG TPA: ATP-binding protein [Lysobacter sp.]